MPEIDVRDLCVLVTAGGSGSGRATDTLSAADGGTIDVTLKS